MRLTIRCAGATLLLWATATLAVVPTPDAVLHVDAIEGGKAHPTTSYGAGFPIVVEPTDCEVACPPGSYEENEPTCGTDYVDVTNGGCNSVPPIFERIPPWSPGDWIFCGTYGGFAIDGVDSRDTDWYEIYTCSGLTIKWCARGEYETLVGIINGMSGCPVTSFYSEATAGPCQEACVTAQLPYGWWWLFVATSGFGDTAGACGGNYVATLSGYFCGDLAIEPSSWGRIKSIYR